MKYWQEDLLCIADDRWCVQAWFRKTVLNNYAVSWWVRSAR